MCERMAKFTGRPRWKCLYAILIVGAAVVVLLEFLPLEPRLAAALGDATIGSTLVTLAWWVRANRAAFDLAEWCACASARVTVRVIMPRPLPAPTPGTEHDELTEPALH